MLDKPNLSIKDLTEQYWILTNLLILAENDVFINLEQDISFKDISAKIDIDSTVLQNMLSLVENYGYLINNNGSFQASPLLVEEINRFGGVTNFIANLRVNIGQAQCLATSIQENKFKLGWHYTDEAILQSQGKLSEIVYDYFKDIKEITDLLSQPKAVFVDIGAGVGKISLKFAQHYPNLKIIAIEPADTPHLLAQENIQQAQCTQIELRKIYAEDIKEHNVFDVVWLPHGFIIDDTDFINALKASYFGLKDGGVLISVNVELLDQLPYNRLKYSMYCANRKTKDLVELFANIGFKEVRILPTLNGQTPLMAIK